MGRGDRDDAFYRVRVRGHLGAGGAAWFDDLRVTNGADGTAEIAGHLADQAALFGLLGQIQGLGLPLIAIERGPPGRREEGATRDSPTSTTTDERHDAQ